MNQNNELFLELQNRFKRDQQLSKVNFGEEYGKNCQNNSQWLKDIISKDGWLSEDKVGKQGELYAWLIVQHSDDIDFQKICLKLLKELPKIKERNQSIAYLTDRILVKENKKQIYGTQFLEGKVYPVFDKNNMVKRRLEMGLE